MRRSRVVGVLFAVFALVLTANPVAADSRTIQVFDLPFFGCAASQRDVKVPPGVATNGALHVCWVRFRPTFFTEPWQASTGEWIFFNYQMGLKKCADWGGTASMTLNGTQVPVNMLPCQAAPPEAPFPFGIGMGYLSHPLGPGSYTATLTLSPAPPAPNSLPSPVTVTVARVG